MSDGQAGVVVREFEPGDEVAFRQLNEEWIVRYFKLEAKDGYALANPRAAILDPGGRIFFGVRDGVAVGCCALLAMGAGEFELGKMAVTASAQGMGIGRLMLECVVEAARATGAKRLYLETNSTLTPAIRLYTAAGFRDVPPERATPSPYARADVSMEMWLQG